MINVYKIKRFSYDLIKGIDQGKEYINSQVDSGLSTIHDISTKITEDPRIKDVKPVKRYGNFAKDLSYLLKRKNKKNKKRNSNNHE